MPRLSSFGFASEASAVPAIMTETSNIRVSANIFFIAWFFLSAPSSRRFGQNWPNQQKKTRRIRPPRLAPFAALRPFLLKLQRRSSAQTFPLPLPASGFLAPLRPPPRLPDIVSGISRLRQSYSSGTAPASNRIPLRRKRIFNCPWIILQPRKKKKISAEAAQNQEARGAASVPRPRVFARAKNPQKRRSAP